MKRSFQVAIAYLAAPRGCEWQAESFSVTALSLEEAERVGLKLLNRQVAVSKLWDYAVTAKSLDPQTERSLQ